MFGLGERKCKECGVALAKMEALGDRVDDLMRSSTLGSVEPISDLCARCRVALTKSTPSIAMNLHVIEARKDEGRKEVQASRDSLAQQPLALNITAQASDSPPRTIAHVASDKPAQAPVSYEPGGDYKTEEEKNALFNAPTFDQIGNFQDLLLWLIGTKVGRQVGIAAFVFLAMFANSFDGDDYAPVDVPVAPETSSDAIQPPSEDTARPPAPTATLPARPENNPGNWVTPDDYPARALNEGREGATSFRLTVNAQGAVTECIITKASGHDDLDATTCSAISRRARFERAPVGAPERSYSNRVTWRIPE
jgi:TonB family protein